MRPADADAVLFDLDGVLTDTAVVHERAWARMFVEFFDVLSRDAYATPWQQAVRPARASDRPYEVYRGEDYFAHIDGKPRFDGVRAMLASRGIELPDGVPQDLPGSRTVAGLGNRKNEIFEEILRIEGVQAYPGSVALLNALVERAAPMAVVSSSRNAPAVLAAAGLTHHFTCVVDGVVAASAGLPGKPSPDTFLHAAALLGVSPARTVVVEDAISGVRAGKAGGFWVIGVDRGAGRDDLIASGADLVVNDLLELVDATSPSTSLDGSR